MNKTAESVWKECLIFIKDNLQQQAYITWFEPIIPIELKDNTLTIKTKKEKTSNKKNGSDEILHQGISKRYFERSFTIADDVKVLGAELKDGLLTVSLERIIPEEKKERVIEIK